MDALLDRFLAGDRRALSRIITLVESGAGEGRALVQKLFERTGSAHTVGVTGGTGSGKSTLTGALATEYRGRGRTVGIVAVDPSSPFTHGALLGDRIRMQQLALDPGVFIRSMASRGALGGLAPALGEVVQLMDAFGFEYVLIETVGAGQDEVEIASAALTTVVVNNPGAGDDIQALKAGILETADVLVVNKADRPGADTLAGQLEAMLALAPAGMRRPPVLKTIATSGGGAPELADAIAAHLAWLEESGRLVESRRTRARHQVLGLARAIMLERAERAVPENELARLIDEVVARQIDPRGAAERLAAAAARDTISP